LRGVPAEGGAEDAKIERLCRSIFVAVARGRLPPLNDFDFDFKKILTLKTLTFYCKIISKLSPVFGFRIRVLA
jgi:hypothetical protein